MENTKRYPQIKKRIEEYIVCCENKTKTTYYYHKNNVVSKMFETLEDARAFKKEIDRIETQNILNDYKVSTNYLEYPFNIAHILDIDISNCVNEISDRVEWLFSNVKCFSDREKKVFDYRFKECETLDEIGKKLDISRERVRQIEVKVMSKIKRFKDFLEIGEYASKLALAKKEHDEYIERIKPYWTYCSAKEFIEKFENERYFVETKPTTDVNKMYIKDLGFSVRTYNCLKRAGIEKVSELLQIGESDFLRITNLGRKSLREIKMKLTEYGLELHKQSVCKVNGNGWRVWFEFNE